jgi:TatD DNase family protein
MLVDSHCHLFPGYFPCGAGAPLARAREAGVHGFVCVGVGHDVEPARHAVALAQSRPDVVAAVAVHPHDAICCTDALFDQVAALAAHPCVVAVGEIGLDFHYDRSPRAAQRLVFRRFLDLAAQLRKPVIVHTREADQDTLDILREQGATDIGGVFHCFSGDVAFARSALDLGFDVSLSGIVTFPKATALHDVARFVPEDRLYVETDSPYLAPVPVRGKKCEPAYVTHTARFVAGLRGVSFESLAESTTRNVCRRLGLRDWPPAAIRPIPGAAA